MKKVVTLLLALLLFALPVSGEAMSWWDYTDDILEDGRPIYYFPELSLTLPAQWNGKVIVFTEDGGMAFYQKASYEKYREEGYEGGGFLFRLGASVNTSFSQLPSFRYLGFSEESAMNYYLELPSDYRAYNEEDIRAEYNAMFAQIDEIVAGASFYAGLTVEDGTGESSTDSGTADSAVIPPAQARYQFEHRMMPQYFYDRPESVLNGIKEVGFYWLWESVCTENGIDPTYPASDYVEHWYSCSDDTVIAQIELPKPDADTLCYRIYFVHNAETGVTGYYTVEYDGLLGESAFLCGWTPELEHENYGGAALLDKNDSAYEEQLISEAEQVAVLAGVSTTLIPADNTIEVYDDPDDYREEEQDLALIPCPELGFTVKADPAYSWDYEDGTGISIYTEHEGSIPYVIVWRSEDLIGEPLDYIKEQFTPHMQQQYGDDLVSYVEYEYYDIGGRKLPAGLYTYRLQGYLIDMLRIYDSTGDRTVAYTAKYIKNEGDATLAALDTVVRTFETEDDPEVGQGEDILPGSDEENDRIGTDETEVDPNYRSPEIISSGVFDYYVNNDKETITVMDYSGDGDMIEIPSSIDGYMVTEIGHEAFSYKKMKSLLLPDTIATIGLRAFEYCTITDECRLPENVSILKDAFSYAELPEVLTIPAGAVVGKCAFSYCEKVRQVLVGENAVIGERAFEYCDDLEEVVRGEGSQVEERAFDYCDKLR